VLDKKISVFDKEAWAFSGDWKTFQRKGWPGETFYDQSKFAEKPGDAVEITFTGSGIAIDGNWIKDGGKADVYLDGKFVRTIDTYFFYSNQEHENITLWHITGLPEIQHTVKLVLKGAKNPEAAGSKVYITQATIFKTASKKSALAKFSFEK
jgi:hypothetical protein